jgi:hypothetical protein
MPTRAADENEHIGYTSFGEHVLMGLSQSLPGRELVPPNQSSWTPLSIRLRSSIRRQKWSDMTPRQHEIRTRRASRWIER